MQNNTRAVNFTDKTAIQEFSQCSYNKQKILSQNFNANTNAHKLAFVHVS